MIIVWSQSDRSFFLMQADSINLLQKYFLFCRLFFYIFFSCSVAKPIIQLFSLKFYLGTKLVIVSDIYRKKHSLPSFIKSFDVVDVLSKGK